MTNWKTKLTQRWNESPVEVIGVVALAATAVAKVIDAVSSSRSRRAYVKAVNYRVKHRR